jgi:two-component system alkaline phosphatase synthesis response regulator PhoP
VKAAGGMPGVVLVVEDDRELRELVRRYLERAGHPVHTTGSGAEALGLLSSDGVELVVLDLGLPDVDGREVLAAAHHGAGREVPVVVLTARSAVEDRIDGLRGGADDYVTKPFSPTELVLRVQAVLHRTRGGVAAPGPVAFGGGRLRIDEVRHEASVDGAPVELTPTEWGC